MAEKGYVWEFHLSLNTVGGYAVDVESRLLQLTDTGKMVHYLIRHLPQRHWMLAFNVYLDNYFATQPEMVELGFAGDRSMWQMQTAVPKSSNGAKGCEKS